MRNEKNQYIARSKKETTKGPHSRPYTQLVKIFPILVYASALAAVEKAGDIIIPGREKDRLSSDS
jgi:hypothetical protein